ncbi:MAG: M55 family metallopeptidase [Lentisphaeria bacterium]
MKVYVMVDMEGISGICLKSQVNKGNDQYEKGRQYMTWDVNACVEGCFQGGAEAVLVMDCHDTTTNLLWEELDPRAEYLMGERRYGLMPFLDEFDALMMLGYHAMAATPEAVLEHTANSTQWQHCWINGEKAGEIAINTYIAGEHGLPVIMVCGDDKACAEALRLHPAIHTAAVKRGVDLQTARFLSRERSHELIRQTAKESVSASGPILPLKASSPCQVRIEYTSRTPIPLFRPGVRQVADRTVEACGESFEETLYSLIY